MTIAILIMSAVFALSHGNCPDMWVKFEDKCYHFGHDTEAMPVAQLLCRQMGGYIVEINTQEENDFIASQVSQARRLFWIGVDDIEVEDVWVMSESQRPVEYTNWSAGQPEIKPDQNCVMIEASGRWAVNTCSINFNYICEKPEEYNGTN